MSIVTEDNHIRMNGASNITQRITEISGKINSLEPAQKED